MGAVVLMVLMGAGVLMVLGGSSNGSEGAVVLQFSLLKCRVCLNQSKKSSVSTGRP